jgi:PAS domain S-box-containing protein
VYYESAALERVLGYRSEEQVGTNAFDWIHPEDIDRALKLFIGALSRGFASMGHEHRTPPSLPAQPLSTMPITSL